MLNYGNGHGFTRTFPTASLPPVLPPPLSSPGRRHRLTSRTPDPATGRRRIRLRAISPAGRRREPRRRRGQGFLEPAPLPEAAEPRRSQPPAVVPSIRSCLRTEAASAPPPATSPHPSTAGRRPPSPAS